MELSGRYIPGRVQPDKAIDVIDESGARVRLKSMTKPPDLADLEEQIEMLSIEKDEAVKNADYEKASSHFRTLAHKDLCLILTSKNRTVHRTDICQRKTLQSTHDGLTREINRE